MLQIRFISISNKPPAWVNEGFREYAKRLSSTCSFDLIEIPVEKRNNQKNMEVKGRDLIDGIPKTIVVTDEEIREALREPVMSIVDTVRTCLERTPPELAADIVDKGIVLTGGGALLRGLDLLLRQETDLPITVGDDPLSCVALGTGKVLDELNLLKKVAIPA